MTWAIKPHPMTPTLSRPAISTPSEYVATFHRPYRKGSAVSTPWGGVDYELFAHGALIPRLQTSILRVGSRGQRNTSRKAGKVGLQEGGVCEARKVQAEAEAVYGSPDRGAVGAQSGWGVRNPNRPPHGSVPEFGPRLYP